METRPIEPDPHWRLYQFLAARREKVIDRSKMKIAGGAFPPPDASEEQLKDGLPLFLNQFIGRLESTCDESTADIKASATLHGDALMHAGFTVGQVVKNYGSLCQAITEVASEEGFSILADEFKCLNGSLDDAIAAAVSEFERQRDQTGAEKDIMGFGVLVHEMRNALNTAMFAFDLIREGTVGVNGNTGGILHRSLTRMCDVIDRSMAEVRLKTGAETRTPSSLVALLRDVVFSAEVDALAHGMSFTSELMPEDMIIEADPHLLTSALTNVLQNAFKFSRPHGHVFLRTIASAEDVRIEIEDQCGGLPSGKADELFHAFKQKGTDRSGLGLGLAISRQAAEAHGGTLEVRDLPGQGCVFTVTLPRTRHAET